MALRPLARFALGGVEYWGGIIYFDFCDGGNGGNDDEENEKIEGKEAGNQFP